MKIGILGAGQLARMLILAGKPLGFDFVTYSSSIQDTTRDLAPGILGDFENREALAQFTKACDLITYENENIPQPATAQLEQTHPLHPPVAALTCANDRLNEKRCFQTLDIPTNAFHPVNAKSDLTHAAKALGFPFVLKSRRFGYDGKHQWILKDATQCAEFPEETCQNLLAEAFVAFDREVSIIAVRSQTGELAFYDLCENTHERGILMQTVNRPNDALHPAACDYAQRLLEHVNYVGVLACEFFVKDHQLIANEIAPRVHNTGHWTIEGAQTSQFENHLRAIAGLPLGGTESIALCIMQNCLGEMPALHAVLENPRAHVHNYQKTPRPMRKVGHVTIRI